MKGYTPDLSKSSKKELSSKSHTSFIELGMLKHKEDCECKKCK